MYISAVGLFVMSGICGESDVKGMKGRVTWSSHLWELGWWKKDYADTDVVKKQVVFTSENFFMT